MKGRRSGGPEEGSLGLRRGRPRAAFLGAALLAVGCAAAFRAPSVSIVGARVVSLGLDGGTAALVLQVVNPNGRAIRVNEVRYRLLVQADSTDDVWSTLSKGGRSEAVTLAAGDSTRVSLEVPFEYRSVGAAVRTLMRGRDLPYRVEGVVRVEGPSGELRVPLSKNGVLKP